MAAQEMMSPIRRKSQDLPPRTPASAGASSIQPSPNRTEAAAAMMHLLTGANSEEGKTCPALKPAKAKRRYTRRAPKKVGTTAKRQIKTAWADSDAAPTEKPPVKAEATKTPEEGDTGKDQKNGDWRMDGDEVRFFPYREYNRKEKSLGLLCENFLKLYRDGQISEICLDRAATELGVERRRIYDIVNILESIHLVSRKSKNLYNWHGLHSLPTSISAMKQRYADVQKSSPTGSSGKEYPPIKSDRRRGKSLSKLSQMFVQLFLGKEDCIIPLEQAAKQLIRMEDCENEEDRLLKTKIRRLYDVANVLVSVGLFEKLQLSNSRKPLFRWKTRSVAASSGSTNSSESVLKADEIENNSAHGNPGSIERFEDMGPIPEMDVMNSPQSCDSDMFEEGSDSQSDTSNCAGKRKQKDQESDVSMSDGESFAKRSRLGENKLPPLENMAKLLRMDTNNEPVHPQVILSEQQEQVKQYMQQYIREYVDYLAAHQKLPEGTTFSPSAQAVTGSRGLSIPRTSKSSTILKKNHGTPESLPSLAGSIQDLLLSESPQSVADIVAARVLNHPRPSLDGFAVAVEPEADAARRTLILRAGAKRTGAAVKVPSTSTKSKTNIEEEGYDAPRNLIMALQSRSQSYR